MHLWLENSSIMPKQKVTHWLFIISLWVWLSLCEFMSRLRTKTYKFWRVRWDFYLLANIVERKQFKGVVEKYSGAWWVSLFKTGKPSSLGLDNCWKKVPKVGVDSRRERDSFLHIRRGADCEARLQFGVGTDRLSCGQQPGGGSARSRSLGHLGPTGDPGC